MINGNIRLFRKATSYFAYIRFFEEDDAPKETMLSAITSTGKGGKKNDLQTPKEGIPKQQTDSPEVHP